MVQKNITEGKKFLVLALVSAVVVVAVFTTIISSNAPSGSATIRHAIDITRSSTGTVWTCVFENGYHWTHTYEDGSVGTISGYLNAESINCDPNYWDASCKVDNTCNLDNEGKECVCRKQIETTTQMPAGG